MNLDELQHLSGQDRAIYYRRQAEAALRSAESATDYGVRVAQLLMADSWSKLAEHCAGLDRYRRRGPGDTPRAVRQTTNHRLGSSDCNSATD